MAFHYSPKIVTDGLVLYIDAANKNSVSGTNSIYDISKTQNTVVPYKNTSLVNNHLYFGGGGPTGATTSNSDYIYVGDTSSSYCNLSQVTLEAWCNPDITNAYQYLFSNSRDISQPGLNGYELYIRNGYGIFQIVNNGVLVQANTLSLIPINTWSHIAATYDGVALKIYINGVLNRTINSTMGIGIPSTYEMRIGRMGLGGVGDSYYVYKGYIDISRIYNRSLSPTEIFQNFKAQRTRFGL
jgi:hypothetical protein